MTKVILVPKNKFLTEINDGKPDNVFEVREEDIPYKASDFEVSTWQKIYDKLIEVLENVDCREYKYFYEQLSELTDFALANAKILARRLQAFLADYFKEEIEVLEKDKPRYTKSAKYILE